MGYRNIMEKEYVSTAQAAKILGVSRMQVVRKIKRGEIKAKRIGRSFAISKDDLDPIYKPASIKELASIDKGVEKVVKEYGEVLKKLGKE